MVVLPNPFDSKDKCTPYPLVQSYFLCYKFLIHFLKLLCTPVIFSVILQPKPISKKVNLTVPSVGLVGEFSH